MKYIYRDRRKEDGNFITIWAVNGKTAEWR